MALVRFHLRVHRVDLAVAETFQLIPLSPNVPSILFLIILIHINSLLSISPLQMFAHRFRFVLCVITFLALASIYSNQIIINFTFICMTKDQNDTITMTDGVGEVSKSIHSSCSLPDNVTTIRPVRSLLFSLRLELEQCLPPFLSLIYSRKWVRGKR